MADSLTSGGGNAYRVLARKYRPTHFGELIGQEPMVRTLKNAFAHNRIPQAWMLTGVRGVGKTTTARILARALNYETAEGARGPTVDFSQPGIHCQAIMEGRHVDVIEMDAASHTGVDNIRDLTDAARYKPVSALYKVYIIDEVHMLSTPSFNALLKTLEEPPEHVKFIFATTEIRKVPVTVLSRCQRFDLRRVETEPLAAHLTAVAELENVSVEDEAFRLIARAAEGSVRDALSLLDQAISHGGGAVVAADVRDMLGLADRSRVVDLFETVMKGDAAAALSELSAQYDVGADPSVVLADLAAFTHQVTRLKVTNAAPDPGEPPEVRERAARFAAALPMNALSRMWQVLLAGMSEVQGAPKPLAAAEMVVIRLCYMASLPDPAEMTLTPAREGSAGGAGGGHAGSAPAPGGGATAGDAVRKASTPAPPREAGDGRAAATALRGPGTAQTATVAQPDGGVSPADFAEVADLMSRHSVRLKHAVERSMRLKRFERGRIEVAVDDAADADIAGALGQKLTELTGERWIVSVSQGGGAPTLRETYEAEQAQLKAEVVREPLVKTLLESFSDAEITTVRVNPTSTGTGADKAEGE